MWGIGRWKQNDLLKEPNEKSADLLVSSFHECLRLGERYLIFCLLAAAASVAALGDERLVDLLLPFVHPTTNVVWGSSITISWCLAWLTLSAVRHAKRLARGILNHNFYPT